MIVPVPGAQFYPEFLSQKEEKALLLALESQVEWKQHHIQLFGKSHPVPRQVAYCSYPEFPYAYSGHQLKIQPFPPAIEALMHRLNHNFKQQFNSVLLNLYRDGNDSMGWHHDNEKSLNPRHGIASVSLGAVRTFMWRKKGEKKLHKIQLSSGSCLLMDAENLANYAHALPKRMKVEEPRYNMTFRCMLSQ